VFGDVCVIVYVTVGFEMNEWKQHIKLANVCECWNYFDTILAVLFDAAATSSQKTRRGYMAIDNYPRHIIGN